MFLTSKLNDARLHTLLLPICLVLLSVSSTAEPDQSTSSEDLSEHEQLLEKQFEQGVDFIMSEYMEDSGSWPGFNGKPDVAMTAMPVKILAEAPPAYLEQYEAEFKAGVQYLLNAQQPSGAILDADKVPQLANYKTALATMALVAAQDAYPKWEHSRFQKVILNARKYLANTQFSPGFHDIGEDHWAYGSWDYDRSKEKADGDMSNAQFALQALNAADLPEDSEVWDRAVSFLQRSQNRSESNDLKEFFQEKGYSVGDDGGFIYYPGKTYAGKKKMPDGSTRLRSYGSMTYAGLKSYIYAQLDRQDPRVQSAYQWVQKNYTLDKNPGMAQAGNPERGKQALFYYYHTLSKALSVWGDPYIQKLHEDGSTTKHHWARELVRKLADLQRDNGSWKNEVGRWREDNPLLVTNFSLMSLNNCRNWIDKTDSSESK
jgi:squalene-hopene/tetraprenyl-beta-curcumene cyclase